MAERAPREDDAREERSDRGRGSQQADPDGADVKNREREHGRERDRVAEEHGDEIERDRAEEHARVDDEADSGRQVLPRQFHGGRGRSHRLDAEDGNEADQEQRTRGDVDGDRLELEDHRT